MAVTTIIFHLVVVEIIQESKVLHRLCGQRGAYDSKRANKNALLFYFQETFTGLLRQTLWILSI